MKKIFLILLICVIGFSFISYNIYDNSRRESVGEFIVETLNGYDTVKEDTDEVLSRWAENYQDKNFFSEDYKYELLSDVNGFNNTISFMKRVSDFIKEDPFMVLENIPEYNTPEVQQYYAYYSEELLEKDNRVFEENNRYFINYSDLKFDNNGYDYVTYGNFHIYINQRDFEKESFTERQEANRFSMVGKVENGDEVYYRIFDTDLNDSIEVRVEFSTFFVKSCTIE